MGERVKLHFMPVSVDRPSRRGNTQVDKHTRSYRPEGRAPRLFGSEEIAGSAARRRMRERPEM